MSRNLDVALHVGETGIELPDIPPPSAGYVIQSANAPVAGDSVQTIWAPAGGSGGVPAATREGQILSAKPVATGLGTVLNWIPDDFDAGRY